MEGQESQERDNGKGASGIRRRGSSRRPREEPAKAVEEGFLSKEDLSNFLAIKPYLSERGRGIVDLLEELHRRGNRLDPSIIARLIGLFGGEAGQNLAALGPLLGMAGPGGKLDPAAHVTLLGSLAQSSSAAKEGG